MLTIVTHPDPILITKGEKIKDPLSDQIQVLLPEMVDAMRRANGIGLAAQQIGKAIQLCVIEIEDEMYYIMNPKITAYSREETSMDEGCLSIPGKFYPICRPQKVQLRYVDEKGEKQKLRASGLLARAIQHELDHLNGILIIDRLKEKDTCKTQMTKKRMEL